MHVPSAYDYRFSSPRRDQILDLIKKLFIIETGQNCPVFCVSAKDLQGFTTTESDMKKGKSKFPDNEHRNYKEDIMLATAKTSLNLQQPGLQKSDSVYSSTPTEETMDYE